MLGTKSLKDEVCYYYYSKENNESTLVYYHRKAVIRLGLLFLICVLTTYCWIWNLDHIRLPSSVQAEEESTLLVQLVSTVQQQSNASKNATKNNRNATHNIDSQQPVQHSDPELVMNTNGPSPHDEEKQQQQQQPHRRPSMDPLTSVYDCLQMPEANLTFWEQPEAALQHFFEIHDALKPWLDKVPKPKNPCIEYDWVWASEKRIATMMDHNNKRNNATKDKMVLSDTFGPYIPLLLPWLGLTKRNGIIRQYPTEFLDTLLSVLRPDIPYVTVSQNDDGILWPTQSEGINISNILVLSAGGYGHVPVPLFQIERFLWEEHEKVLNRSYLVSYVGSMGHAPHKLREQMNATLTLELGSTNNYTYYKGPQWLDIMRDSWVSMTPRGYGRTAFHVVEALQQGLIPVHVYIKTKWVPYGALFDTLGYSTTLEELPNLIAQFKTMSPRDFLERENRIANYRDSHFSMAGTMEQIFAYLAPHYAMATNGFQSDLVCHGLPNSTVYD